MAKPDLKRLLKEGLTGKEAARLIIADSVEVDHGRPGYLSQREISAIKDGLRGQEASEYNRWLRAFQLVDYSVKEARIAALEACNFLWWARDALQIIRLEERVRGLMMSSIPAIVTQKQYEELKARQKEQRLAGLSRVADTIYFFLVGIEGLDFEEIEPLLYHPWDEGRGGQYWDEVLEEIQAEHPEAWRKALQKIIQLVRAGQLRPVPIGRAAQGKLQALEAEAQRHREEQDAKREAEKEQGLPLDMGDMGFWDKYEARETLIIRKAYETGLPKYDGARTLQALEALRDGRLAKSARDSLLDATYCPDRELYGAGLMPDLDKYEPGLDEASSARPKGMMQAQKVAIIVDPEPHALDERGWYKDYGAIALTELSGYKSRMARAEKGGPSLVGPGLMALRHLATEKIKLFLAIQGVVEVISQALGVALGEDFDNWQAEIEAGVGIYNLYSTPLDMGNGASAQPPYYLGIPKAPPIKLGKLKPTAKSVQYYRDRMAMALGEEWWTLGSHVMGLEYEPPEEQSLAGEFLAELIQGSESRGANGAREGLDGQE